MARSITIEAAAREMAVSPDTVRALLRRGELRGHRVGRAIRVYAESLGDFQRRHELTPPPQPTRRAKRTSAGHQEAMAALKGLGIDS